MPSEISIIIPIYNCDKYLDTCIRSVLMQSFSNFEVICVDDNSTDNSLFIINRYSKEDKRIKLLTNDKNRGSGYSRNRALDIAEGKYIFFLDSDDWIEKETLEFLYKQCEKDDLDVIMFKNIVYYEEKTDFGYENYYDMNFMNKYEGKIFNHWDLKPGDVFRMPVGPCNKLYKKSFLDKNNIRFPNENLIQQDNPFFFKVITSAERLSLSTKYLYNRRRRSNSVMSSLGDERLFSRIYIAELLVKYFLNDVNLYNHYKKYLFSRVSNHLTDECYEVIKEDFKQEMYDAIHDLYIKFFDQYDLKEDIFEYVDEKLLFKYGLIKK
ncbi:glycosyltransferase family 2 protein [Methanobrevibacter sp.]|uniref:glycosyltransferase family 2 protein n=1 Tax=Methanobrevibacter sp. TaxID=66852 RepID=UPI0038677A78